MQIKSRPETNKGPWLGKKMRSTEKASYDFIILCESVSGKWKRKKSWKKSGYIQSNIKMQKDRVEIETLP